MECNVSGAFLGATATREGGKCGEVGACNFEAVHLVTLLPYMLDSVLPLRWRPEEAKLGALGLLPAGLPAKSTGSFRKEPWRLMLPGAMPGLAGETTDPCLLRGDGPTEDRRRKRECLREEVVQWSLGIKMGPGGRLLLALSISTLEHSIILSRQEGNMGR